MTTRKGGKKQPQRHQNTFKYYHNPGSKKTKQIQESPIEGLCKRCSEIIEWKKDYRKYKPLTTPRRCDTCNEKRITRAYHVLCQRCATEKNVCAKCRQNSLIVREFGMSLKEKEEEKQMELQLKEMTERERRTYFRSLEKPTQDKNKEEGDGGEEIDELESFDDEVSSDDTFDDVNCLLESALEKKKYSQTKEDILHTEEDIFHTEPGHSDDTLNTKI